MKGDWSSDPSHYVRTYSFPRLFCYQEILESLRSIVYYDKRLEQMIKWNLRYKSLKLTAQQEAYLLDFWKTKLTDVKTCKSEYFIKNCIDIYT